MSDGIQHIEIGGINEVERPKKRNPNKGTTRYPFNQLELGQVMYVARTVGAVRDAVRRWEANNKDSKRKFEVWRGADKRAVVKRVK